MALYRLTFLGRNSTKHYLKNNLAISDCLDFRELKAIQTSLHLEVTIVIY